MILILDASPKVQEMMRINGQIFMDGVKSLLPGEKTHGATKSLTVIVDLENPSHVSMTQETDESYSIKSDIDSGGNVSDTF